MPDLWWVDCFEGENEKDYLSNANGYFGCEATEDDGEFNGFSKSRSGLIWRSILT